MVATVGPNMVEGQPHKSGVVQTDSSLAPNPRRPLQPQFGQTSPLRNNLISSNNAVFNVPKPNKTRPEHHREFGNAPPSHTFPSAQTHPFDPRPIYSRPPVSNFGDPRLTQQSTTSFQRPIYPTSTSSGHLVPRTFPAFRPPQNPVKPSAIPSSTHSILSRPQLSYEEGLDLYDDKFGAADPTLWVNSDKANESIKALLEGAFDSSGDEEDEKDNREGQDDIATTNSKSGPSLDELSDRMNSLNVQAPSIHPKPCVKKKTKASSGMIKGLSVPLLPHQVEGVTWMRSKEVGTTKMSKKKGVRPKGGILADDMGLGKTIQSIALILTNTRPPKSTEASEKSRSALSDQVGESTLIVAPLALIRQWEAEIKDKVEESHRLRVCVHHGPQRSKRYEELRKYDVVITTYQVLVSEHGNSSENDNGPKVGCFGINWYRVILDEAHTIKNRNAKATKAACTLKSEYRWCLTGTPMQNNLDELQSLINFLRIMPFADLATWKSQISQPMANGRGGLAIKRLQVYLKAFMKRRTKEILKADGALDPAGGKDSKTPGSGPGFKIVARDVKTIVAEFSDPERTFYERLEQRTDKSLQQMMGGQVLNYASALVLLLRLRQACNHPELVGGDLEVDRDAMNYTSQSPQKARVVDRDIDDIASLLGGLKVETRNCSICQITIREEGSQSSSNRCRDCQVDLENLAVKSKNKTAAAKQFDEPTAREQHATHDGAVGNSSKIDGDSKAAAILASAKIRQLLDLLRKEVLESKIIVFSIFTSMLNLIEPHLREAHMTYTRYDGSMRNDHREAALGRLRNDPDCRILLCSLKCGSLGLNLTAASRVVILEPFWNPFVEEQAIDRVHRLNQTKDVVVYKLTVKNTVEERILALQEKKRALANAAIEGKDKIGKLSMEDILGLFNRNAEHDVQHLQRVKDSSFASSRHPSIAYKMSDNQPGKSHLTAPTAQNGRVISSAPRKVTPTSNAHSAERAREDAVFGRRW